MTLSFHELMLIHPLREASFAHGGPTLGRRPSLSREREPVPARGKTCSAWRTPAAASAIASR